MSDEELASDGVDEDFQRWFVGGSPPEADGWPRHAFEDALIRGGSSTPNSREFSTLIPRMTDGDPRGYLNNGVQGAANGG